MNRFDYVSRTREHQRSNRARQCTVSGCTGLRRGLGQYCARHRDRFRFLGHPTARRIERGEYQYEMTLVRNFLQRHGEHPGVRAAIDWASLWLKDAAAGNKVAGGGEMKRLAEHGGTGRTIVEEVLALWLYSRWRPSALPDDERLTKAFAYRIFAHCPRVRTRKLPKGRFDYKPVGSRPLHDVGAHLRLTLAPFVVNVIKHIEAEESAKKNWYGALRAPFESIEQASSPTEAIAGEFYLPDSRD